MQPASTDEERIYARCAWRLIPFLSLLFLLNYLDRVNVGFMALFVPAGPLAFIVGGPVSGAILTVREFGGLSGWQWLFIIEGLPTLLLALTVPLILPNSPSRAKWLAESDKRKLLDSLAREN